MKILILGLNYAPEKVGIAVYTTGMAEYLSAKGHQVQVVSGQPYYPSWHIMKGFSAWRYNKAQENGVKITRVPHYIPAKPTGIKRLIHHASFAFCAFFPMIGKAMRYRPDVIITIAPSLIGAPVAKIASMLSGAKSWLHIQDFEVETAFATGLIKSKNFLAKMALAFENFTIKKFDRVSSISPQMCKKLAEKGVQSEKITEFRNWADIEAIKPLDRPSSYRKKWNITSKHVALYSGNIANKQGIDIVIDAAKSLQHHKDLTFIICGEGPNRTNLEQQAVGLLNVQFHDLQPKENLNELMGLATIHLLPQIANAADLVLPSKLANMLASGRPIVATAANGTGLAEEVEGCGIITPPKDAKAFAGAIELLMNDEDLYQRCCTQARLRAKSNWARDIILSEFEENIKTYCLKEIITKESADV